MIQERYITKNFALTLSNFMLVSVNVLCEVKTLMFNQALHGLVIRGWPYSASKRFINIDLVLLMQSRSRIKILDRYKVRDQRTFENYCGTLCLIVTQLHFLRRCDCMSPERGGLYKKPGGRLCQAEAKFRVTMMCHLTLKGDSTTDETQ